MTDGWQEFHRRWPKLKPPLRPNPQVVAAIRSALADRRDHVLLLGVTPELADIGAQTTALDRTENMIRHIWPGDTQTRRAILGNWLAMPSGARRFSAAIGDGSLNIIVYSKYPALFGQLEHVLLPGARIAIRLFETPDMCESLAELKDRTLCGAYESFHGFKWRLAMSVVTEHGGPDLPVKLLHEIFTREFPDRDALARATAWPRDDIDGIDAYAGNDAIYSFPTRRQMLAAIPSRFCGRRFIASGSYELAERCPILVADFLP